MSDCRFCGAGLERVVVDLGMSPLANSYVSPDRLGAMEPFYPLRALVCESCLLMQVGEHEAAETIFSDYPYFSSYSSTWVDHARRYAEAMVERLGLGEESLVVELASNDGYLLRFFHERRIPVLGVEPAPNVADVAIRHGIPTLVRFFGAELARTLAGDSTADLLVANNVIAHVPDLNDFVEGMRIVLGPGGVLTAEFPHLARLLEGNQWDTIYHEHFSYFTFATAVAIMRAHGLEVFDVDELPTHGGSLRIYAAHAGEREPDETVGALLEREAAAGLDRVETYEAFGERVARDKREILSFLSGLKDDGLRIAGYGAPAKGNTLLNYCGIGTDLIDFTVDVSPHKQGLHLPGSRIPVLAPAALRERRPDVVLILPWNLTAEVIEEHGYISEWGGRFAARAPHMRLLP